MLQFFDDILKERMVTSEVTGDITKDMSGTVSGSGGTKGFSWLFFPKNFE